MIIKPLRGIKYVGMPILKFISPNKSRSLFGLGGAWLLPCKVTL